LLPLHRSSGANELDINKRILDTAMVNDKLLILPYSANPLVVLYNKDFFDKAHIPYPQGDWTWEQFRDISKKLKPAPGSAIPYLPMILEMLMASTGKSTLSPNADTSVGYLDSPEAIRSIQWLNHYYQDDELKTAPMSFMDAGIQFNNFQTGMALGTIESYTFYKQNLGEKIGVASLPHFESGTRANPISFSGFGISKNSKHPDEAWAYIQYLTLTNHENAAQFSNFNLTTSKSMSEAVHQDTDPIKSVFVDEMNYAVKPTGFKSPLMYNEDLNTQFQELLKTDDKDIPAKLQDLALKVDQEIKRIENAKAEQTESASP
jgi:multiple sugar transport system substrate-binding protein